MGETNMGDVVLGVAIGGVAGFALGRMSGKKLGKKEAEKAKPAVKNGGKKQSEKEKKDKKRLSHHGGYKPLPSQPLPRHHSVSGYRPPTTTTTTTIYSHHPAKPVYQSQLPPHAAPRPVPAGQGLHLQTAPHWNQHDHSRASSRAPPTQMQVRGPEPYHPSYYY